MSAVNIKAQTEQTTPRLDVDYSHRLAEPCLNESSDFTDSAMLASDRLLGVLYMLSISLAEGIHLSDKLTCGVIDAAICEAEDIKSLISAFNEFRRAKRKA